jgi:hypothetical protein
LNGPDLISSHLGELDHRDDGSWWKRDPYFLYRSWRVWKRKKRECFWLVNPMHTWDWSSLSTLHRQRIISQQVSLASFFLGFFFPPLFPCFRCQNFGEI